MSVLAGILVGVSLGLTGGGGSIIAVPLLVYGIGLPPHDAVGVSLAAVAATAATGAVPRLRSGLVEVRAGLLFAAAGMVGAPFGTRLGTALPERLLLASFACLMVLVALRIWRRTVTHPEDALVVRASGARGVDEGGPACRHDASGRLRMTGRCSVVLVVTGVATGVLSGLYGVGGGFIIVPALMFFTSLSIRQAVATSLLTITLISSAGILSFMATGSGLRWDVAGLFIVGGSGGMGLGMLLSRRLSAVRLQKIFAVVILILGAYIIGRSLWAPTLH